jgi:hypothetical protein
VSETSNTSATGRLSVDDRMAKARAAITEGEVGVVRDNARPLKFEAESTGFED